MKICDEKECTGCFACMNICRKDAISIGHDGLLKTIPVIDDDKCVGCGLCIKACPVNNQIQPAIVKKAYAATSNIKDDEVLSSSGGVATVLSRYIIRNGGITYGAASMDGTVKHIRVDNIPDLKLLQGSKYVQSSIGYIYRDVKRDLAQEKSVIFIGTPCQIAGLKQFLNKEYDNLITVDLVCHGTPPVKYLEQYLAEKRIGEWDRVVFRKGTSFILTVFKDTKIIYEKKSQFDRYYKAFLTSLIFRDNCYSCEYAREERISDITLGDFWDIDKTKLKNNFNGRISLVLINTEKGESVLHDCGSELIYEERAIEEGMNESQENLHHPSIMHEDRKKFEKNFRQNGFSYAVKHTKNEKEILKALFKSIVTRNKLYQIIFHRKKKT